MPKIGYGAYEKIRLFTAGVPGVWVQQITFQANVVGANGRNVIADNHMLAGNSTVTYYEAFPISAAGSVRDDSFITPGWPNGSKGTFTVTGQAQFYPNATMADFPELRRLGVSGHVVFAGQAPSSTTVPVNWYGTDGAVKIVLPVHIP